MSPRCLTMPSTSGSAELAETCNGCSGRSSPRTGSPSEAETAPMSADPSDSRLTGLDNSRHRTREAELSAAGSYPRDRLSRPQVREVVLVTNDRALTLTYDEDAGQVVLQGHPCGSVGEADEPQIMATMSRLDAVRSPAPSPGSWR